MTNITKTEKVLNALVGGAELTAKQVTSRYGVKNVRAVMSKLRTEGYPIFLNKRVSSFDGQTQDLYCGLDKVPDTLTAIPFNTISHFL